MRHVVKLREAAALTGLSYNELRTGALSGKYPAMRVGSQHGRILFDMDMLNAQITEIMEQNCKQFETDLSGKIRKIKTK